MKNAIIKRTHFYTLEGEKVFLASYEEMEELGIRPIFRFDNTDFCGVSAYSIDDYREDIKVCVTLMEERTKHYADDFAEIYLGEAINLKNDEHIKKAWLLEEDRQEVYDELCKNGYYQGDENLDKQLCIGGYEGLYHAMFEWGSDAEYLETTDDAFRVYTILRDATFTNVIDAYNDEFEACKEALDLEDCEVKKIFEFVANGVQGSICLQKDYI